MTHQVRMLGMVAPNSRRRFVTLPSVILRLCAPAAGAAFLVGVGSVGLSAPAHASVASFCTGIGATQFGSTNDCLKSFLTPGTTAWTMPAAQQHGDVRGASDAGVMRVSTRCPSPSVGGKPIGWITVDGLRVPIKAFTYPAGGVMDPPASNQVAGLSRRHAPLDASTGTSIITWHLRYGEGCEGALNPLLDQPVGSTFSIRDRNGALTEYALTAKGEVPKGAYKAAWFDQTGPHRLALFTCGGLIGGKFTTTQYILAVPKS